VQINRAMHLSSSSSFFMRLGSSEARRSRLVCSQSSSSLCLAVAASASEQICTPNTHHCMKLTGSRLHMHAHRRWLSSMQRSAVKHVVLSSGQAQSWLCHQETVFHLCCICQECVQGASDGIELQPCICSFPIFVSNSILELPQLSAHLLYCMLPLSAK